MQCRAMQCNQCSAINAVQCNAMQCKCNAMQCKCNAMQCRAMQCNQCNAVQCNAVQMQCNAMQSDSMHHVPSATCCNPTAWTLSQSYVDRGRHGSLTTAASLAHTSTHSRHDKPPSTHQSINIPTHSHSKSQLHQPRSVKSHLLLSGCNLIDT